MPWTHAQVEKLLVDAVFNGDYEPYNGRLAWSRLFYDDIDAKTFRTIDYRWIQNGEADKVNFDEDKEDLYGFNMAQILEQYRVLGQPPPNVDYMEHDPLEDGDTMADWRGDSILLCLGEHRKGGNPDYRYIIVKIGSRQTKFSGDERTKYLEKRNLEQNVDDVRRTLVYESSQRNLVAAGPHQSVDVSNAVFSDTDTLWTRIEARSTESKGNDEAEMNLGWVDDRSYIIAKEKADILHEFGQALGMLHDHQSPSRGGRPMINPADVVDFYTNNQNWASDMVDQQVLSAYNLADVSDFSPLNTESIMHNPMPARATPDGKDTPNYDSSALDMASMTIDYPRSIEQEDDEKSRGVPDDAVVMDDSTVSGLPNVKFPGFQQILWSKLNDLFGPSEGASSFLSLQYPTRFLEKDEFGYELEGSHSNFVKPVSANEAEFRLTDQLYDAARVVSGPNGKSLSTIYELMLNNLIPRSLPADNGHQSRAKLRAWLHGQISDQNSSYKNDAQTEQQERSILPDSAAKEWMSSRPDRSAARNMSRMKLAESLYSDYHAAEEKYRHDLGSKVTEALEAPEEDRPKRLGDLKRYLATEGAIDNAKLSSKYNDAVVRGDLHVLRDSIFHLDIKNAAEQLQDAKDSLRESALSSIFGASRVWPVNMQPLDWSQSLDTDFTPMDLTSDPSVLDMAVQSKMQHVDSLRDQLSAQSHHVAGDETALRKSLDDASVKLSLAQADLAGNYSGSAVLAAKQCIDVQATMAKAAITTGDGLAGIVLKDANASESEKTRFLSLVQEFNPAARVRDLVDAMAKVDDAQRAVQREAARYSQQQTDLILSKSTTTAEQTAQVQRQIDLATQELQDLTARLAVARANKERERQIMNPSTGDQAKPSNDGKSGDFTLPSLSEYASVSTSRNGQGGSRWTSVIIDSEEVEKANLDRQTSETSSFETGVSLFLFSASAKHDSATGEHVVGNKASRFKFKLSMNVTLVTVDRSSWFQPQFFDLSNGFMRNNKEITWSTWPKDFDKDVSKAVKEGIHTGQTFNGPLPCFPTGYILGKDINIEISGLDIANEATHKSVIEQTTATGGFLGFRCRKPDQSTSDETAASVKIAKDGLIIRIPGPQILGYIQQVMPVDQSVPFDSKSAF